MELKSPKAKKKSSIDKLISWGRMFKTPLLILFLLGTTNCERESEVNELDSNFKIQSFTGSHLRHRHGNNTDRNIISEIKYLRRHLNKDIVNFVMTDFLIDGEVENRVHYNGVTAKETYVGSDGLGLKLRQLTDGRHLVQVIYTQDGQIQDCEFVSQGKSARNFLKTLRKELKLALDEEIYRIANKQQQNSIEDERFYRHFRNVTFRVIKDGERLPPNISKWFDYDKLKMECLKRHEELQYMMENRNKAGESSLARSRRSLRENFIVPGTKWCGAGHIAAKYGELGLDAKEDRCCRAHDHCRLNIGMFRRRFGYFNYRPYTISHCRCDRSLGLKLRQLTDGRHLVQVIYTQDGQIQDCEFVSQGKSARNFLKTLRKELKLALDEEIYRIANKQQQNSIEDERFYRHFRNVTFRVIKDGERLPPNISKWFDYDKLKMECLKRHEELQYMMENRNKAGESSLARSKRDTMELLRVPGTKWCGKGFSATRYSQLGGHTRTDRCCRVHDLRCPFWIGGMEKKYGIYNWRVNTLMHCRCDERFRACLKLADTSVSNMVGKLFFNVVQTKCFILKPVKMCTQRSWWGKCLRRGYTKQAFLRDNLPY